MEFFPYDFDVLLDVEKNKSKFNEDHLIALFYNILSGIK